MIEYYADIAGVDYDLKFSWQGTVLIHCKLVSVSFMVINFSSARTIPFKCFLTGDLNKRLDNQ